MFIPTKRTWKLSLRLGTTATKEREIYQLLSIIRNLQVEPLMTTYYEDI